ncbi:putative sterol desaturase family protein [Eutypa lata UCREL1]|uniref:Putative sterol desaturase family protein n=1 Tax=Eutypa lata (strain UCR-EL1) TaxID=1287681 RepID=M7SJQ5_EUTLA|nr:putative sterol desaturase family protein [Eutypa lata UCREL1]
MDVLLSLPIVSYFAAPMMTSWSTSLNLLFFYMTWSTLVLSHSPLHIELIGTLAIRLVFSLAPALLFLLFDTLLPSVAESIKFYGAASLPPRNARALARQGLLVLLNVALLSATQGAISAGATYVLGRPLFKTSTTLPLPWQIIKHIGALYAIREVLTYSVNRYILHSRSNKNNNPLVAQHARYAHSRDRKGAAPYSLMLYTDHPLPLLVSRLVPSYLPAALLVRPHLLTYFLFTALATAEDTLAASGYSIVPGIVMGGITRRTAAHYASAGRGSYGSWGLLDWACGTSAGGGGQDVVGDLQDEAEKHQVRERGEKAAGDAGGALQSGIDGLRKKGKGRKKT